MARDIIDRLTEDHDQVRELMDRFDRTTPDQREELFREIVAELARHEAAEEALVHRTVRDDVPGGDDVVGELLEEESEAERLLADMEKMDPVSEEFADAFRRLRDDVLEHADHEERVEWPELRKLDQQRLIELGERFEVMKDLGPTHPHPMTPQTPEVRAAAGPVAGLFDTARDAVRDALQR